MRLLVRDKAHEMWIPSQVHALNTKLYLDWNRVTHRIVMHLILCPNAPRSTRMPIHPSVMKKKIVVKTPLETQLVTISHIWVILHGIEICRRKFISYNGHLIQLRAETISEWRIEQKKWTVAVSVFTPWSYLKGYLTFLVPLNWLQQLDTVMTRSRVCAFCKTDQITTTAIHIATASFIGHCS